LLITWLGTLVACQQTPDGPGGVPVPPVDRILSIGTVEGLEDTTHTQFEYFNPLKDVRITDYYDEDITHHLHVAGNVHYGKPGSYELLYTMTYGEDQLSIAREIEVVEGAIIKPPVPEQPSTREVVDAGAGSYVRGADSTIEHPVNPQHIEPHLLSRAVPSNQWWTALLVQNQGGGNGLYTNPYRAAFTNLGAELTHSGSGFVQYWNPEGYNTMAHFSLALPDLFINSTDLVSSYRTTVVDYSDTSVTVAMRNPQSLVDHMVLTYVQGSPYVHAAVANETSPNLTLAANGVSHYEFYSVGGTRITGTSHTGAGLIVRLVQKHVGYETSRPAQVGQPTYADRYFLISTPEDSTFTFSNAGHPFGLNNRISMQLNNENYFSIASINALSEAAFYHQHAYNRPLKGDVSYRVDAENSHVVTTYQNSYQSLKPGAAEQPLIQFLMPHHYQGSDLTLTNYTTRTVRGLLKVYQGAAFQTVLPFHGVIPAMPKPNDAAFSASTMRDYLQDLTTRTDLNDPMNFLNDPGPYWNSKALYPLSQGIIIADQIGEDTLKHELIGRLRFLLRDWFSYAGQTDTRYLFYNQNWGTVYYSNNDFRTATELSDHTFTHGYFVYAASVLAMYDPSFINEYGDVVEMMVRDYLHPEKQDDAFAYLRGFDAWGGHTWAHGFSTFAEGNNLESTSEALNGWLGGYLWALATDDQALKDAAIYGFVHELHHAKTYRFDYEQTIFPEPYSRYAQVAGIYWGGKYDYATWFGANPTFIYGIQWLPNGEYLSSYALDDFERARLNTIYSTYLGAKNQVVDTWFANMWSIQALLDPARAISLFDANKILQDDYPSDLAQTYYLIHGLHAFGQRNIEYGMHVHDVLAASIYQDDNGHVHALVWNPSAHPQVATFRTPDGQTIQRTIPAASLNSYRLND
ncbi:MAG: hypothetical protein EA374_04075, partial [Acholeplasmatales bacterium]